MLWGLVAVLMDRAESCKLYIMHVEMKKWSLNTLRNCEQLLITKIIPLMA